MSSSTTPPTTDSSLVRSGWFETRKAALLRDGWIFVVLIGLVVFFSLTSSNFLSQANWLNTSSTATEVMLLALGETFVIITAGIDLSVGAVLGLAGMTGGWVMSHMLQNNTGSTAVVVGIGFAATIAVGVIGGLINGWLVAYARIPSFVVTLGTLGIASGLANLYSNGQEISQLPAWVGTFGNTNIGGWVPVPVLITAILCVITVIMLAKTRFGAFTYTIGDSEDAAARAGIPFKRHLVKVYALAGILAGIDAVLVMTRVAAASPASGATDNLNAIAAVVIGGASLFGGRGTILGSIIGTLIISVLLTGLIVINVAPFWQEVAVGVVLILAVFIDQYSERLRSRQ